MSEFIAIAFDTALEAEETLARLKRLQREYLIDLEDAVIAVRDAEGKVDLKQSVNLASLGAATQGLSGAFFGGLIGILFLSPLAGMAIGGLVGAGAGAISGSLADFGINDDLIREIADSLKPGGSALFLLVRKSQPEKILAEFQGSKGRIIRSSLSFETEEKIRAALTATSA